MCRIVLYDNREPGEISLEAVRQLTDVQLPGEIIAIADLAFPNGRRDGYNLLDNNLSSVFFFENGNCCFYITSNDLYADVFDDPKTKHFVTFRMWHPDVDETKKRRFCEKILAGQVTYKNMEAWTESLVPYLKKIYQF